MIKNCVPMNPKRDDFFADLTLIRLNKFPLFADKEARDRVECDYFLGIH